MVWCGAVQLQYSCCGCMSNCFILFHINIIICFPILVAIRTRKREKADEFFQGKNYLLAINTCDRYIYCTEYNASQPNITE